MLTVCVSFVHQPFGNHFGKQPKIGVLFISACTCYGYVYQKKRQLGSLEPSTLNMSDAGGNGGRKDFRTGTPCGYTIQCIYLHDFLKTYFTPFYNIKPSSK